MECGKRYNLLKRATDHLEKCSVCSELPEPKPRISRKKEVVENETETTEPVEDKEPGIEGSENEPDTEGSESGHEGTGSNDSENATEPQQRTNDDQGQTEPQGKREIDTEAESTASEGIEELFGEASHKGSREPDLSGIETTPATKGHKESSSQQRTKPIESKDITDNYFVVLIIRASSSFLNKMADTEDFTIKDNDLDRIEELAKRMKGVKLKPWQEILIIIVGAWLVPFISHGSKLGSFFKDKFSGLGGKIFGKDKPQEIKNKQHNKSSAEKVPDKIPNENSGFL